MRLLFLFLIAWLLGGCATTSEVEHRTLFYDDDKWRVLKIVSGTVVTAPFATNATEITTHMSVRDKRTGRIDLHEVPSGSSVGFSDGVLLFGKKVR